MMGLIASVRAWIGVRRVRRYRNGFRRFRGNLDGLLGVRKRVYGDTPRTRLRRGTFVRAPGRRVDWPGEPPSRWKDMNPEDYV